MLQRNHLHKANKISKVQSKKPFLGHQSKGMKVFFMGIIIHVMDMVTNILNVDLMKGDIMEDSITPQGIGDVNK
jgi:phage-related holin